MTSSGGFSSFHVRYKYQAARQELLDSWEDKRMTGFKISWRIETHLFQFEETQIGKELQISGLGDTSLANRDYSHKITLAMPSNLEELIGGDRLLKIEIEADVGRGNGYRRWLEYFEGKKYVLKSKSRNWTESQTACEQDGGQLALAKTSGELKGVALLKPTTKSGKDPEEGFFGTWLGASKDLEGAWHWVDGDEMKDVKWEAEEDQTPHCALFSKGQWLPRHCGKSYLSMCQLRGNIMREQGKLTLTFSKDQLFKKFKAFL